MKSWIIEVLTFFIQKEDQFNCIVITSTTTINKDSSYILFIYLLNLIEQSTYQEERNYHYSLLKQIMTKTS